MADPDDASTWELVNLIIDTQRMAFLSSGDVYWGNLANILLVCAGLPPRRLYKGPAVFEPPTLWRVYLTSCHAPVAMQAVFELVDSAISTSVIDAETTRSWTSKPLRSLPVGGADVDQNLQLVLQSIGIIGFTDTRFIRNNILILQGNRDVLIDI